MQNVVGLFDLKQQNDRFSSCDAAFSLPSLSSLRPFHYHSCLVSTNGIRLRIYIEYSKLKSIGAGTHILHTNLPLAPARLIDKNLLII